MAKIAEMAERKSEKKEVNPVLMEIAGKDGKALNSAAAKKVASKSFIFRRMTLRAS